MHNVIITRSWRYFYFEICYRWLSSGHFLRHGVLWLCVCCVKNNFFFFLFFSCSWSCSCSVVLSLVLFLVHLLFLLLLPHNFGWLLLYRNHDNHFDGLCRRWNSRRYRRHRSRHHRLQMCQVRIKMTNLIAATLTESRNAYNDTRFSVKFVWLRQYLQYLKKWYSFQSTIIWRNAHNLLFQLLSFQV